MLRKSGNMSGLKVVANDGDFGKVSYFLFDDERWVVRYVVVRTGPWLFGREVILSPYIITEVDKANHCIRVDAGKAQLKDAPDLDTKQPISRQMEAEYLLYYQFPAYWGGVGLWGHRSAPLEHVEAHRQEDQGSPRPDAEDDTSHIRSTREVTGYTVHAVDGDCGRIDDFVVDEDTWAIRYLLVDTGKRLGRKEVLLPARLLDRVDWWGAEVFVNSSKEKIEGSPEIDPSEDIGRDHEAAIYDYYTLHRYWQ